MLTAICKEYGIPPLLDDDGNVVDPLHALLLFKAKKNTGDYHANMNSNNFCEWLETRLFPVLESHNIKAILVLDNASYHCCAAEGSINPDSFTSKEKILEAIQNINGALGRRSRTPPIQYKEGRANKQNPAAGGDSLDDLKKKLKDWLKSYADTERIIVNKMKIDLLCENYGHFPPLWTPPYHPELQPIELLWRTVKGYVARKYVGGRSMNELEAQVRDGFLKYGSAEFVSGHLMRDVLEFENKYKTEGYHRDVVPRSWDDYILTEDAELFAELGEGINGDIDEEDQGVFDGEAMADVGEE